MNPRELTGCGNRASESFVPARYDETPKTIHTGREVGSVEREMGKLAEAVASAEHTFGRLVDRIKPAILITPPPGKPAQTSAPDAHVCDVAAQIRGLRRQLEMVTEQIAHVSDSVDL